MRKSVTLVSAALVPVPAAAGTSEAHAADPDSTTRSTRAISAAESHAATTSFGDSRGHRAVNTLVERDGASHVGPACTHRVLDAVDASPCLAWRVMSGGCWSTSAGTFDGHCVSGTCDRESVTGIGRAAARDIRGAGSTQDNTVAAAWRAVAVS